MKSRWIVVLLGMGLGLWGALFEKWPISDAYASGLNAPQVGNAFSSPVHSDAAAVFWNPAMLATLTEIQGMMGASLVYLHLGYTRDRRATYQHEDGFRIAEPLAQSDIDFSKSGLDSAVSVDGVLGTFGGFLALPIGDRVVLGGGVYVPYGAIVDFGNDANGPQKWALQRAQILSVYVTPSAGFKITDWFRVGFGTSLVIGNLALSRINDLAGTDLIGDALADDPIGQPNDFGTNAPPSVRELDVLSRPVEISNAWALGYSFNVGMAFRPTNWMDIGITYTHGTKMRFKGEFRLDMNHPFFTTDLVSQGLEYPPLVKGDAYVEFPFPTNVRFAVGLKPAEKWFLQLEADWFRYSEVKAFAVTLESKDLAQPALGIAPIAKIDLRLDWQDTVQIEALVSHDLSEELTLGFKFGYHSPFSPDSTVDVSSPDGNRLIAGVMTRWDVDQNWSIVGQLDAQALLPRKVTASDHDLANGKYNLFLLNAGGSVTYRF